jgi:DNA-binding LytR/AlgR family response regulator
VHKSYLVNLRHIAELHRDESGYVLMDDGTKIPFSSKDKEQIIQSIKKASHLI